MEAQTLRGEAIEPAQTLFSDLIELVKPRITLMVLITTAAGFWLGAPSIEPLAFWSTLLGTALIAAGASCLNQVFEVRTDALMNRTRQRPLPAGRMERRHAAAFGVLISIAGALLLAAAANRLTAELGILTLLLYVAVYTPLKRVNSLCT